MTPYLQDADCTLYHGDVLDVLRDLPAESVDCCVTSPPYWGLRDYGTGAWEGGDEGCDHRVRPNWTPEKMESSTLKGRATNQNHEREGYGAECARCGATRIDQQLGLEPTPEEYVERMVEVFREIRRVLAPHGTVWLNLGDSYAADHAQKRTRIENYGIQEGIPGSRHRDFMGTPVGLKPKDLVGIPWRVAFALQADGWWLRSDIIWAKPNPMPESVTDRPTKAHEYVFLLSKNPRYFFDQEAVREPSFDTGTRNTEGWKTSQDNHLPNGHPPHRGFQNRDFSAGRNIRSVWEIATQPYPEAHFATFPEEMARRCIAAGCSEQVCRVCGKATERIIDRGELIGTDRGGNYKGREAEVIAAKPVGARMAMNPGTPGLSYENKTTGFTDCGHSDYRPGTVLDPFIGSGTVAYVARKLGRHSIGIDLSDSYLKLAAKRLQQQSLFAEV